MFMASSIGLSYHFSSKPWPLSSWNLQMPLKSLKNRESVKIGYNIVSATFLFAGFFSIFFSISWFAPHGAWRCFAAIMIDIRRSRWINCAYSRSLTLIISYFLPILKPGTCIFLRFLAFSLTFKSSKFSVSVISFW